jgi:DHA3 family macrolide efflux protein-like MFS transporter
MKNPNQPVPQHWAVRFFTIWTGQAFSLFGSALVQFALVWWLTQKTGSAVVLTTAALVGMLPQVVIGPFAGALVDRWNRRVIMMAADATIAAFTILLIWLFATGQIQIWHVYAVMTARSLGAAFHFPAMSASTPLMVPEKHLTRVSGLNQTLMGLMNMIAPPIGALLLEVMSTQGILMIDVVTAALAILPLFFFSIPQPERREAEAHGQKPGLLGDVRAGLDYIRGWPGIVAILSMAFFLNFLLTPAGALTPLLITKHFGKGALEFGLMDSAWGFGVIAGGLILGAWGGFKKKVATAMMGIIGIGIGVVVVGLAPSTAFGLALAGMAFAGVMNPITNGPLDALLQTIVRPDMQGRVMSLVASGATAMTPLGLLIAGPISDVIGIRAWYWIAGLLTLLMGAAGFFIPAVMNVENNHNGQVESPPTQVLQTSAD